MSFKDIGSVPGITDEQAKDAALFLTGSAHDQDDARLLLEACGLLPYESGTPVKAKPEQGAVIKFPRPGQ